METHCVTATTAPKDTDNKTTSSDNPAASYARAVSNFKTSPTNSTKVATPELQEPKDDGETSTHRRKDRKRQARRKQLVNGNTAEKLQKPPNQKPEPSKEAKEDTSKKRFIPAPLPTENPWQRINGTPVEAKEPLSEERVLQPLNRETVSNDQVAAAVVKKTKRSSKLQWKSMEANFNTGRVDDRNRDRRAKSRKGPPADVRRSEPATAAASGQEQEVFCSRDPAEESALKECIRLQVEHYFSEENLCRDVFLRRRMDREGYVPVALIASFPCVQQMSGDLLFILEAISDSTKVEITQYQIRTSHEPTKWPLQDDIKSSAARLIPPPPLPRVFRMHNLNPEVPEFVPEIH